MKQALNLLSSAARPPAAPAALSGWRTPFCWRRDLSRRMEPLAATRQACGWIAQLAEVRPRLFEQPLLGHCLTELTEHGAPPSAVAPEEPRPRRAYCEQPELAAWESRRRAATNAADSARRRQAPPGRAPQPAAPRRPAPMVFQLSPRADRSMLRRLTGETEFNREGVTQPRRSIAKPPRESEVPAAADARASRDWLNVLARRAERAWRDGLERRRTASGAAVDDAPRQDSPPLATEWARPLDGQTVSMETLAQLAKLVPPHGARARRDASHARDINHSRDANHAAEQPVAGDQGSSSPTAARRSRGAGRQDDGLSLEARPKRAAGQSTTVSAPASSEVSAIDHRQALAREPTATTTAAWLDLSRSNSGDREPEEFEWPPPARIAPPAVAPSLPPLLPPQMAGAVTPPIAAATARQSAKKVETAARAAEDHGDRQLAARLKRILDEEARRHGIDV